MKGSLFPLGRPLRELEDRPRAGSVPRLQPRLRPAAVGVAWALRLLPTATAPQGRTEHRVPPAQRPVPLPLLRSAAGMILGIMNGMHPPVWGALLFAYMETGCLWA